MIAWLPGYTFKTGRRKAFAPHTISRIHRSKMQHWILAFKKEECVQSERLLTRFFQEHFSPAVTSEHFFKDSPCKTHCIQPDVSKRLCSGGQNLPAQLIFPWHQNWTILALTAMVNFTDWISIGHAIFSKDLYIMLCISHIASQSIILHQAYVRCWIIASFSLWILTAVDCFESPFSAKNQN